MDSFHKNHPEISMLVNVRRHPYSFFGDDKGRRGGFGAYVEGQESDWDKGLLGTCNGDVAARERIKRDMLTLAQRAGISTLRYDVKTNWQPVNSQRMLLWATRQGKAEEYMKALGRKHFEEAKSASHTWTVLDAAEEAGLDRGEADAFSRQKSFQLKFGYRMAPPSGRKIYMPSHILCSTHLSAMQVHSRVAEVRHTL